MNAPTQMTAAREAWWKRENLLPAVVLLALTMAAWAYTIDQARAMGSLAMGEMGTTGEFALFLFGWAAMMVAMMLPAALPLILLYRVVASKRISHTSALATTPALLAGYLAI